MVREEGVPAHLQALVDEKRAELIERLADVDDEVGLGAVGFYCAKARSPSRAFSRRVRGACVWAVAWRRRCVRV